MYAFRIIALVGVIGAGQNVSNTSLRDSGEGVSYAHGWIDVDRRSHWGGEPSIIGEFITPGGLACRFDSQWDNGVKTICELKETFRLPPLELELNFADRRPSPVSRDNAAIDCAFDLASSELKEPSLAHHICRKDRDKIVVGTAFLDQPANIWVFDLHQVGPIAPDRALQFDTSSETPTLSCIHLDGLHALAPDLAYPEYDAAPQEREGRSVVIGADKTLAGRVLEARRAQNRAVAQPQDVARVNRKLEFDLLRHSADCSSYTKQRVLSAHFGFAPGSSWPSQYMTPWLVSF